MTSDSSETASAPCLLGEWGEGYCRFCRFVEPLDRHGLIARHVRGAMLPDPKECKGSSTRPGKNVPKESRLSSFSSRQRKGVCPSCGQELKLLSDGRVGMHSPARWPTHSPPGIPCPGSAQVPVGRSR